MEGEEEEINEGEEVEDAEVEELNAEIGRLKRAHRKARAKYQKLETELADPLVQATRVLEDKENTFFNFERYEATLFNSFIKGQRELERLQAARTGKKKKKSGHNRS